MNACIIFDQATVKGEIWGSCELCQYTAPLPALSAYNVLFPKIDQIGDYIVSYYCKRSDIITVTDR